MEFFQLIKIFLFYFLNKYIFKETYISLKDKTPKIGKEIDIFFEKYIHKIVTKNPHQNQ